MSNTVLTFELNILSLVLILICFALQNVLNMMNATLAFCILASSVPPFLLVVLPRYVNEYVSSSGSPFNVMELYFFVLAFFVLLLLRLSPSCVDTVFSRVLFLF